MTPHPNDIRAPIEEEHNTARDKIEADFVAARVSLEEKYLADLSANQLAKQQALMDAGLNPDGGVPSRFDPAVAIAEPEAGETEEEPAPKKSTRNKKSTK